MAKKTYQQLNLKKQTKQTSSRDRTWIQRAFDGCQMGGMWENG